MTRSTWACVAAGAAGLLAGCASPPHRWDPLPSLPGPISNNAAVAVPPGGAVLSLMGITDPADPASITREVWMLAPRSGAWERLPDAPPWLGRGRIAANAASVGGRIFLLGGYTVEPATGEEQTDPRLLELVKEKEWVWRERTPPPIPVDDTVVGVYKDRWLYLVSGWTGPEKTNTTAVQVYDAATDSWQQAAPIPGAGVFGHGGGVVGDSLVCFGGAKIEATRDGRAFVLSRSAYAARLDAANPAQLEWFPIDVPRGAMLYRPAVSASGGRLLVVGGTDNPYNIDGVGYNGAPAEPSGMVFVLDAELEWHEFEVVGVKPATMDHRAIVPFDDGWAVVGGMTAPGEATNGAWRLRLGR